MPAITHAILVTKHPTASRLEVFRLGIPTTDSDPRRPDIGTSPKLIRTCPCSPGLPDFKTPDGLYQVIVKARSPEWRIPASSWATDAGLVPGTVIPGDDPANPLVVTFMALTQKRDIGIHGTREHNWPKLGSPASHGCIRVHPDEARWLHKNVPTGTPVVVTGSET